MRGNDVCRVEAHSHPQERTMGDQPLEPGAAKTFPVGTPLLEDEPGVDVPAVPAQIGEEMLRVVVRVVAAVHQYPCVPEDSRHQRSSRKALCSCEAPCLWTSGRLPTSTGGCRRERSTSGGRRALPGDLRWPKR